MSRLTSVGSGMVLSTVLVLASAGNAGAQGIDWAAGEKYIRSQPIEHWAKVLEDPDYGKAYAAVYALDMLGPDTPGTVPLLTKAVQHKCPGIRRSAIITLGRFGPRAKPALLALRSAMCAAQVDVRIEAARAVWTLANDRTAIPVLAAALRDGYWSGIAAEALGDIGPAAKEALPALLPLLRYNGGQTRIFAVEAISKIGGGAMELLPPLLQACSDADCRVRQAAVQAIGKIGPNACAAAPTLIRLLDDFHGTVRVAAAEALWNIEKHPAAIERIAAELSTDDRAPALVIVPSPQDASPLPDVSTMTDFPAAVHQAAVAALVRISPAAPQAIAVLRDVKRHDRRSVHIMAALALAKTIPNENPLPTLTAGLTSPKYSVRICAADALAKMGTQAKSATPALLEALRVCAAEAPALPRLKEFEFLESLRANFETNDRVSHSRAWSGILGALREIDPKAASAYESGPDFKALLNYETR